MTTTPAWAGLTNQSTELDILKRVVVRHIVDGLHSGNPIAAALARSLMTELDAAGLPVDTAVDALRGDLADEHRAAGA